jgi:serine/threonine-protein kinase
MRPTLNMQGAIISGRYRLGDLVGEGGMGGVFRAFDQTLERDVAVKLLFSGDERDREQRVSRFLREARIAAAVQHKNIVSIIDFGSTEDGRPYMVMEYLEGETLAGRLSRSPAPTIEEVVHIVAATLGGLARAHDMGVVHRDMKPENVFLVHDADGAYPKILDFGISRSVLPESGPSSALTTREGFLVGTPQYMSPEQARGLKDVDRATDIYSIGVILYEALTGRLPFNSEHVGDLIILIATGSSHTVSEVREELGEPLSEVVRKAMQVDRDKRYPDARAMRDALLEALERLDEEARALRCPERVRRSLAPPKPTAATRDGRGGEDAPKTGAGVTRERAAHAATLPAMPSDPGAIGVPVRPSTATAETPRAWTVDAERPKVSTVTFAAIVMGLVLVGGAWTLWGREAVTPEDERRSATDVPEASSVERANDARDAELASEEPGQSRIAGQVTFTLEGVPLDAVVTFDGEPTTELALTAPRDGEEHVVEVVAAGFEPFVARLRADDDARIAVALTPHPSEVTPNHTMRRSGTRPPPVTMTSTTGDMRPPAVLDDLDY